MRKLLLITFSFFVSIIAFSQVNGTEPCGQRELIDQLEKQYPGFKKQMDVDYLKTVHPKVSIEPRRKKITDTMYYYDTIYTIPVVFHVLYNVPSENIHDSLLQNQIEVLNTDFRRNNADSVNTRAVFKPRAGDVRIQFELAKIDPNGNPTNGIIRKPTSITSWGSNGINNNMKYSSAGGNDNWNPLKYMNIWVCDLTFKNNDGLLGFAYPPYGHPSWGGTSWVGGKDQGVVLHYKMVGRNNPLATTPVLAAANKGRVAVHEVGHFLGLRHIWADDQGTFNRCMLDDYIDDTPLQGLGSNFDCNKNLNSCIEPKNDMPDMVENYMDYSTHLCQNMFTKQQAITMRNALTDFRKDLPIKTEIIVKARIYDTIVYNEVLIYPVAAQSKLVIELRNQYLLATLSVEIYNMIGQPVLQNQTIGKNFTELSTMKFPPATYIVVLRNSEGKVVRNKKIVIDRVD